MKIRTRDIEAFEQTATVANAIEWNETPEKWSFCVDRLYLSLGLNGEDYTEFVVNKLEDIFCKLLSVSEEN
jgi:hypothetical protein